MQDEKRRSLEPRLVESYFDTKVKISPMRLDRYLDQQLIGEALKRREKNSLFCLEPKMFLLIINKTEAINEFQTHCSFEKKRAAKCSSDAS